ncbi:PREDICTED: L10-interacting MYB domain-containing protein-like isoform X2 [Nelumbo nucifera]|uniref:L10-interacting MYB domain-containing protein-like isoform X2 n=1 Tax=Nelumbo nucifera TaxID=4432 RepID=A0A1U7Z801_NELNU|nr:PREDICTED: L10-interacting MYB domain-containing protein-like isoform X2 [Nelumbo nucifera]
MVQVIDTKVQGPAKLAPCLYFYCFICLQSDPITDWSSVPLPCRSEAARPHFQFAIPKKWDLLLFFEGAFGRTHNPRFKVAIGRFKALNLEAWTPETEGMENQATPNGDRPRTKWTSVMDRYFIDIMIEEVHKGNKIRNTFRKKAWEDMVSLFNTKFGLQLDKEILRNRSKKLRLKCNAVKTLLAHNGFHWDDSRKMVKADDHVWDEYLKEWRLLHCLKIHNLWHCLQVMKIFVWCPEKIEGTDIQVPTSSERSRTNWTPTMDRYFIDIMIEQVHKGHKNGNIFRKRAWEEMVASFNAKFGLNLDKEVLKNRHKKLRLQYNAMKILLGHGGFHWDETRQMVTADNNVWDDHLKAYPEARSYRTKTVPNYKDMCVIYRNETAYNGSADDVNLAGNTPKTKITGVSGASQSLSVSAVPGDPGVLRSSQFVEGMDNQDPPNIDHSKTWTPPMDRYFMDIMLEQVNNRFKVGNAFCKEAWTNMLALFNSKFGLELDKEALRNQHRKLRMQYNAMKTLLDNNGFYWDETRQMVAAADNIWDDYLKVHPEARLYRAKAMPNYNDLCVIYGNPIVDGRYSCSGHDVVLEDTPEVKIEVEGPHSPTSAAHGDPIIATQESSSHSAGDVDTSNQQSKRPFAAPSTFEHSRKRLRTIDECMVEALRQMALAVTSLANKKKENENETPATLEKVVNALQAIPDIDEDLFLDACDLLEDEQKAKMFLALDATIRKKWLMRKLRP